MSTIKNNTTELQNILNTINNLPEAGSGGALPELTNEGTASDLMATKELIDGEGNKIVGTFTIDSELSTQDNLISQIQTALEGKAAATPTLQEKTATPTASAQTITPDSNYDGLSKVIVSAIPSTYVKPTTTKTATTYTPTTSNQTIAAGTYCSGAQTIKGDANLKAENIVDGISIFGITGTATIGDDPFAKVPPFTYTVDAIDGASYGFTLNSNGYYESQNKGVHNSYAICRVNLAVTSPCDIVFDVINYAENNYDYALFGNLDSALAVSSFVDSNVKKNFKGTNSSSVVNVTYSGITIGNHYIDIKFIKDNSQSNNNDSVQFKIQEQEGAISHETIDKILASDSDLVAENIKSGIDIFGVTGTYVGSSGGSGGGDTSVEDSLVTRTISIYTNDRVTSIGQCAFYFYSDLTAISFPNVTTIGAYAFNGCYNLTTTSFPAVTTIGNYAFAYCSSLTTLSFPNVTTIGAYAFNGCYNLKSLYLPGSSVCALAASTAFASTPIGGYSASAGTYGSIYVPASLFMAYRSASKWSYFSSRFTAI